MTSHHTVSMLHTPTYLLLQNKRQFLLKNLDADQFIKAYASNFCLGSKIACTIGLYVCGEDSQCSHLSVLSPSLWLSPRNELSVASVAPD